MKKLTQVTKKLSLVLIAALILLTSINTNAVASSIQLGGVEALPGYIAGTKFSIKTKTDGTLVYCLNMNKATAKNITANLVGQKDAGMAYILANGYPSKTFTGDRLKDYYITQSAVWWYLDNTTGSSNLSQKFKTTGSDEYNLRPTIKNLVERAEKIQKQGYKKTNIDLAAKSLSMTLKGEYFVSDEIYINQYYNISTYTVSLTGAPANTKIVDLSGNEKTKFNVKDKFQIKVPASAVKATEIKINVTASAEGIVYKAYEYQPTNKNMQPVTPAIPEKEIEKVSSTITLEIESSKVKVVKIDSETKNAIAGATLVLKDAAGNVKSTWVSTTNYHVIRNLPNGTYTVTETQAPEGYILNKEPYKFTISDTNRDIEIKVKNTPRQSVVNIIKTDASTGKTLAGATLVLKDASGNEITRFTTTTEPQVFTNLANGTYLVEEISAPEGYILSKEVITFKITDEALSHQITFENHPEVKVPDTASSSIIITLLGIVIIGTGISFVYKNAKKTN